MIDIERSAIIEFDGGISRKWADFLARMMAAENPVDFLPERWGIIRADMCALIDIWWKTFDRNDMGPSDAWGLGSILSGRLVVAIGNGEALAQTQAGNKTKISRRPLGDGKWKWVNGGRH